MRKILIPALMAMTLGVAGMAASPADAMPFGAQRAQHMAAGPEQQMDRMFNQLNLTDAQKAQIKAIRQRNMEAAKPIRESMRAKHQELFALIRKPETTKDQALAKQREINALQNQLSEARLNAWFEARAVLTPDQLKKLETIQPRQMGPHQGQGRRQGMAR